MKNIFKLLTIISLSFFSLNAQSPPSTETSLPSPENITPDWLQTFLKEVDSPSNSNIQSLQQHLEQISQRAPKEEVNSIEKASKQIIKNIKEIATLKKAKGSKLIPTPKHQDYYSLEDLLEITQTIKENETKEKYTQNKIEQFQKVQLQMEAKLDELFSDYSLLHEHSLEKTLLGLNVMITSTHLAIAREKTRIVKEKLANIEQQLIWNKQLFDQAKKNLNTSNLSLQEIDDNIAIASLERKKLEPNIIQTEVQLIPEESSKKINNDVLKAIDKLLYFSKLNLKILLNKAKKSILYLSQPQLPSKEAHIILNHSKEELDEINKIEKHLSEWKKITKDEQTSINSQILGNQEKYELTSPSYINTYQLLQKVNADIETTEYELFKAEMLTKLVINKTSDKVHWIHSFWDRTYLKIENFLSKVSDKLSTPIFRIKEKPVTYLKLLYSLLILIFTYFFSLFFGKILERISEKKKFINTSLLYSYKRISSYIILFLGFIITLSFIGIDFSNLLLITGALSVGIGFGLQGIVNNFLGGLIILFDHKLRVGDYIELDNGQMGHISEVNVQNTIIRSLSGHDILMPNSMVINKQLTNWTLRDQYARLHLPFGIAYGTDKEKVKQVVEKAANNIEETVLDHKTLATPRVWLVGFGDNSLNFELVVWVDLRKSKKRRTSLRAAYYWEIESALSKNNLEIPFPQRDIHIKSCPKKAEFNC